MIADIADFEVYVKVCEALDPKERTPKCGEALFEL